MVAALGSRRADTQDDSLRLIKVEQAAALIDGERHKEDIRLIVKTSEIVAHGCVFGRRRRGKQSPPADSRRSRV
jgi:hypothetical protein